MFKLAFRNVLRNRKRSLITLTTIVFSTLLVVFSRFVAYGSHQETIWNAVGLSSGYIQVAAYGWLENKPLTRALDVEPELLQSLKVEGVTGVSPRIFGAALVSQAGSSRFVTVLAADSRKEEGITNVHKKLLFGRMPSENTLEETVTVAGVSRTVNVYEAAIGKGLAGILGVKPGSELALVGSQFDGSIGALLLKVVGIYNTQDIRLDNYRVYIPMAGGRELFAPDAGEENKVRYTSLALGVKDYIASERVFETLRKKYPLPEPTPGVKPEDSENYSPVVHRWDELIPGVVQVILLDQVSAELFLGFLILIMAFGVLNNVQMTIHERKKEFGILLALGTRGGQLVRMILIELVFLMGPGLLLGSLVGIAAGYYLEYNPVVFTGDEAQAFIESGFAPVIKAIVNLDELWTGIVSISVPSFLFSLIATLRVLRLNPSRIINSLD